MLHRYHERHCTDAIYRVRTMNDIESNEYTAEIVLNYDSTNVGIAFPCNPILSEVCFTSWHAVSPCISLRHEPPGEFPPMHMHKFSAPMIVSHNTDRTHSRRAPMLRWPADDELNVLIHRYYA